MNTRRTLLVAGLVITPAVLFAQGRGGGRRGGGRGPSEEIVHPSALNAEDFQKLNPAQLLIDKKKDLKLDDSQVKALEDVAKRYDWNSRQYVRLADSIAQTEGPARRMGRGTAGQPDSAAVEKATDRADSTRRALRETLQSVRDEFDIARKRSLEAMRPDQTAAATPIVDKASALLTEQIDGAVVRAGGRSRGGI